MSLRIKLFLGIVLFFAIALSFFGYMAYDSAVRSGTDREMALLDDLATGLSRDFRNDIGANPEKDAISNWIREFDGWHLAIMVSAGDKLWLSESAQSELSDDVRQDILKSHKSGTSKVGDLLYVWDTSPVSGTPYTLSVMHRINGYEAYAIFKRLALPMIVAALIVLWVAVWSTLYIAALLDKLNAQKDTLRHQAMHDALTSLPNRAMMMDRLQTLMREMDQSRASLALLFIDLNRFKEINDTLGHHIGDLLLIEISERLLKVLRKSDLVARLGGDEFAVILSHVSETEALAIAEKLIATIGKAIEIESNKLLVTASIGIARYPLHASDSNSLVQCADVAMYAAKRAGMGHAVYNSKLDANSRDRLILSNDLRDAIATGKLCVYYQPRVDIVSGKIIGAEALLRWNHDSFGWISPERFIPLAEQTGCMRELTDFVMHTAFTDIPRLPDMYSDISISINISIVSLQDRELPTRLASIAEERALPTSRIILEIPESALTEQSIRITEILSKLDSLGFRLSMDNFGTGHSSLVNLRMLPLQEIKIDRSFVMNMLHNEGDAAIVQTIIELGRSLGKQIVAEGVENREILQTLGETGCHVAQGYYLSRPLPFADLNEWLTQSLDEGTIAGICVNSN